MISFVVRTTCNWIRFHLHQFSRLLNFFYIVKKITIRYFHYLYCY